MNELWKLMNYKKRSFKVLWWDIWDKKRTDWKKSLSKSIDFNKYAKTSVFKDVNGMGKNI